MKIGKNNLGKAGVLLIAAFMVLSTSAAIADTSENTTLSVIENTFIGSCPQGERGEEEISYYTGDLTSAVGISGGSGPPFYWKSAIRLTQDELAAYAGWDLIAVVVAHSAEEEPEHWGEIIIYGEGTSTSPGAQITNESYYFDATGWFRVDLTTPVPIDDHDEIWVACSWESWEPDHVAYIDQGPAVDGKGDWLYLNGFWQEIQSPPGNIDSNWGMGAIVEGEGKAELSIINIKGPIGVNAEVKNIGEVDANNLEYTITVTGGMLGLINKTVPGSKTALAPSATEAIGSGLILGFGKIAIEITANADNAVEVTATKTGFVLGILVIGIK